MNLIIANNYEEMSNLAAIEIIDTITKKANAIFGLATGSTPIGTYKILIEMNKRGFIYFSRITTINLDEYIGLSNENVQSYRYFMNDKLFNHINIKKENTFIPNGLANNLEEEVKNYDKKIEKLGGIDIQILGIGANGHIGFNEPHSFLTYGTHVTKLTQSTISANSRFFNSIYEVPKFAITMGVGQIMKAKKILLLVHGKNKTDVLNEVFSGTITTKNPATLLQMHNDVTVILDKSSTI